MLLRSLIISIYAIVVSSCVSSGTHEELQDKHAATAKTLEETKNELEALKKAQKATQLKNKELEMLLKESKINSETTRSQLSDAQKSQKELQKAMAELAERRQAAEARVAEYRKLLARFKNLIDAGKLSVSIIDGRMVVGMNTDILFPSGSARISKEGKTALKEVAAALSEFTEKNIQVEGHTDSDQLRHGSRYKTNWHLAADRAISVIQQLMKGGMQETRLSAASFGEFKPKVSNDTTQGKAQNRRIEIVLLPDLSKLPGFEELKGLTQ